jgi:hypothetical protein
MPLQHDWRLRSAFTVLLVALAQLAAAQQPAPHVGYAYPAGGARASHFQVRVGGQSLDGITAGYVSGPGVQVKLVTLEKPMTGQEAGALRDKLKALQEKKWGVKPGGKIDFSRAPKNSNWTPADEKLLTEIRAKLNKFAGRPPNPAIAQTAVLEVTLAADAPAGRRELRLETPSGFTNPLAFFVGALPETVKPQPADTDLPPPKKFGKAAAQPNTAAPPIVDITLPVVANGQILPGQVDRYRFHARKGEHLVAAASARALIPYVADAVPGWLQAAVTLRDDAGREIAFAGADQFRQDPVLRYEVPRDGQYVIEIADSIFRGREDFVYRLTLGDLPVLDGIFPLGGRTGAQTRVAASGWNLPFHELTLDGRGRSPGVYPLVAPSSNCLLATRDFALDDLPVVAEHEPNDRRASAQHVSLPIVIDGRIGQRGDRDLFAFEGRAGQTVVAEVFARRLGSPLDSALRLTNSAGRTLAFNDDQEDKAFPELTHHADSWLRATLPAAGMYYVELYDAQNQGGPQYAYRLRISPPRPDFQLRIVPSSVNVHRGGSTAVVVYVLPHDGFASEIALALKDAPAGFSLDGARILPGQQRARFTLSVPAGAAAPVALRLEGRAVVGEREIRREAIPADDMQQAFAYHHLVTARQWLVAVAERGPTGLPLRLAEAKSIKLPSGGTATAHFAAPHGAMTREVQYALSEPPDGLAVVKTASTADGLDLTFRADASKLKPGWKGSAIIEGFVLRTVEPPKSTAKSYKKRVSLGMLPAVALEVVAQSPSVKQPPAAQGSRKGAAPQRRQATEKK